MNPVWLLMSAIGIIGSNSLALSPIASVVAHSFAHSYASDVMIASAVYGACTALSALFVAPKADQIGLPRALLISLSGTTIALGLSAIAPVLGVLVISQALCGLCAGFAFPAIYGLAADIAPQGRQSETLGKVLTGWTLSLVVGVSLSAIIADFLHWRVVFAALSGMSLALALLIQKVDLPERAAPATLTFPWAVIAIADLKPILLEVICYMIAFYGLYAYIGTHLTDRLELSTSVAGFAAISYGVGFGAAAPLDRVIDRYGPSRCLPFIYIVLTTTYILLACTSAFGAALIAVCFMWGGANHITLNSLVGQITALSHSQRGAILGLYSAVSYATMSLGIAGYKPIFEFYSLGANALVSALFIALAFVCTLMRKAST